MLAHPSSAQQRSKYWSSGPRDILASGSRPNSAIARQSTNLQAAVSANAIAKESRAPLPKPTSKG